MQIFMKRTIKSLNLSVLGLLIFYGPAIPANAKQYYVAVVHDLSSKTGDVVPPRLLTGSYNVTQTRTDNGYKVVYSNINLSKQDCKKLIKKTINEKKSAYNTLSKEDSKYKINKTSIFANAYVIDQVSEFISVYYCIPSNMWEEIKSQEYKNIGKTISYENAAILHKNNEDFIQKMHKCGITDYGFFHINVPSTPFVCEKYDEEHTVPVQTYDDIIQQ